MKISGGIHNKSIWIPYTVTLNFIGRICASVPADENMMETWLSSRKPKIAPPPGGKSIQQLAEETINRLPSLDEENADIEKRATMVFEQVDGKLCIRAASLRSHLKDCASQVFNQFIGRIQGQRNLTTIAKNGLYIQGDKRDAYGTEIVFFRQNGKPIEKEDGFQERMVHAWTPRGEVSSLKKFAYILKPSLTFVVSTLGNSIKPDVLELILQYGAVHGFGGERSMQEGQYSFELEYDENRVPSRRVDKVETPRSGQIEVVSEKKERTK